MLEYRLDVPAQTLTLPGAPPVQDGRARFRELFCALLTRTPGASARSCELLLHRLSDEPAAAHPTRPLPAHDPSLALVFVPGLLGACPYGLAPPFESTVRRLRHLGYDARLAPVDASSNSRANAERLAHELAAIQAERIVLIGHARGAVDILELLVAHPAAASRVQAVLSVAGAINGSPLAEDPAGAALLFPWGEDTACAVGQRAALADLSRPHRLRWLMDHPLPTGVRYFSLVAFAPAEELTPPLRPRAAELARIDPRNDGLLTFFDQVIPGAVLLGYANADHWSIVSEPVGQGAATGGATSGPPSFPRGVLIEAALLHIIEALADSGAGP